MKICYAISYKFVQQAGISIVSALENNSSEIIDAVIVAGSSLCSNDIERLRKTCQKYQREFVYIDADLLFGEYYRKMQLRGYGGFIAPWMFICPNIIAQYCKTDYLLMLDADTIICDSLKELCEIDFTGYAMAAVIAVNNYRKYIINPELKTITNNKKYFNCGVVLYNIPEWNRNNCWEMIYTTCVKYHPIDVVEQTLINNAIPERLIYTLKPKYNYWGHKYKNQKKIKYELSKGNWYGEGEIEEAIKKAAILHYKDWYCHPWHKDAITTKKGIYQYYKKRSLFNEDNNDSSIYSEIKHTTKYSTLKKKFFLAIEKVNSLSITKFADSFVEFCQWIKMLIRLSIRFKKKENNDNG